MRAAALLALAAIPSALGAQTREDSVAVLRAVERSLHVRLAKPGAEGHFLIVGVGV